MSVLWFSGRTGGVTAFVCEGGVYLTGSAGTLGSQTGKGVTPFAQGTTYTFKLSLWDVPFWVNRYVENLPEGENLKHH